MTSLKYFCEEAPEYHIAVANSLLGVVINREMFFPGRKGNQLMEEVTDIEMKNNQTEAVKGIGVPTGITIDVSRA